ncbi:hypothetical protein PISL3812_01940 [Talaromyces islandicus]|uniref:Uncharacterized protein n=1 Tax=Talaromyces islandicus TaxID=28573 RepID=A0A0U1LNI6_TALIS|nr:hypothetical protein PISL3812_01940 [Talaromyces islandicus]
MKEEKDDDDENEELPQYSSASRLIPWTWWCLLLNTGLVVVAFLAIWKVATPPPTSLHDLTLTNDNKSFPSGQLAWSQKFTSLPCGKSPAEALARGCHFDIVATAWLPPKCIDYELVSEFMASYPWQYFPSANGTDPYSDDPDRNSDWAHLDDPSLALRPLFVYVEEAE